MRAFVLPPFVLAFLFAAFAVFFAGPSAFADVEDDEAPFGDDNYAWWTVHFDGDGVETLIDQQATAFSVDVEADSEGGVYLLGYRAEYQTTLRRLAADATSHWSRTFSQVGPVSLTTSADGQELALVTVSPYDEYNVIPQVYYLDKLDAAGNSLWQLSYSEDELQIGPLAFDPQGGMVLVGSRPATQGPYRGGVVRLDADGNETWLIEIVDCDDRYATVGSVQLDDQQNIYVGYFCAASVREDRLKKLDAAGTEQWTLSLLFEGFLESPYFSVDSRQIVSVAGVIETGNGLRSVALYQYDAAGQHGEGNGALVCEAQNLGVCGLARDADENLLVLGAYLKDSTGEIEDLAPLKFSRDAEPLWSDRIERGGLQDPYAIMAGPQGETFVLFTDGNGGYAGEIHAFLAKYDEAGKRAWLVPCAAADGYEFSQYYLSLASDGAGGVYVTGTRDMGGPETDEDGDKPCGCGS